MQTPFIRQAPQDRARRRALSHSGAAPRIFEEAGATPRPTSARAPSQRLARRAPRPARAPAATTSCTMARRRRPRRGTHLLLLCSQRSTAGSGWDAEASERRRASAARTSTTRSQAASAMRAADAPLSMAAGTSWVGASWVGLRTGLRLYSPDRQVGEGTSQRRCAQGRGQRPLRARVRREKGSLFTAVAWAERGWGGGGGAARESDDLLSKWAKCERSQIAFCSAPTPGFGGLRPICGIRGLSSIFPSSAACTRLSKRLE
jgi:hypothetical protein